MLVLTSIALTLVLWKEDVLWIACLAGGSVILVSAATIWWKWAMRQCPPKHPTLFVVRHRQQDALRLLRLVASHLSQNITTVETLVQSIDDLTETAHQRRLE